MEKKPCRKCLLEELDDVDLARQVQSALQQIPEQGRASQELYEKRLATCRQCDFLLDGMCRKCGCFVQVRAAYESQRCPQIPAYW